MRKLSFAFALVAGVSAIAATSLIVPTTASVAAEEARLVPAAALRITEPKKLQTAVFAGGCFWGVEAVYSHIKGVKNVVSGYHGGAKSTAIYEVTNSGETGHAEAVRITYDPTQVTYTQLLQVYFSVVADPTLLNRQGPDRGTQYRSAIVPMTRDQDKAVRAYIAQLGKAKVFAKPIVTKVEAYKAFYPAEAYHQDFMAKNPDHRYIKMWDAPKVAALKALFPKIYSATMVTG